jgi:thiol:disulfide interchange protein
MTRTERFIRTIAHAAAVTRSLLSRHEKLLWAAAIAVVITVQWPMLKGSFYRAAATSPPPSSIEWRTDLNAALDEARRTDKQVLLDVSADWCPPCIAMKHDVWPDPDVERSVAESYVPVLIDADRDVAVMDRYGITGIPAVLIVDGSGTVIRRATFLSASRMLMFLTPTSPQEFQQ